MTEISTIPASVLNNSLSKVFWNTDFLKRSFEDPSLEFIDDGDVVNTCLQEISKKLSRTHITTHFAGLSPDTLKKLNDPKFQEGIKRVVAKFYNQDTMNIRNAAAINLLLFSIIYSCNNEELFDLGNFLSWKPFHKDVKISNQLLSSYILEKDLKATIKGLLQMFQKFFPLTDQPLMDALCPVHTNIFWVAKELSLGHYKLCDEMVSAQRAFSMAKKRLKTVPYETIEKMVAKTNPIAMYDSQDKLAATYPGLFLIGTLFFTLPSEVVNDPIHSCVLDRNYFTDDEQKKLVRRLNMLTLEELEAFVVVGLSYLNFHDNTCHNGALVCMDRLLRPISKPDIGGISKQYSEVMELHLKRRSNIQAHELINLRQAYAAKPKGAAALTEKIMERISNRVAENEAFSKHISKSTYLGNYLGICQKYGIPIDEKITDLINTNKIGIKEL